MKSKIERNESWNWEIDGTLVSVVCNEKNPIGINPYIKLGINPYIKLSQGENSITISLRNLEEITKDVRSFQYRAESPVQVK